MLEVFLKWGNGHAPPNIYNDFESSGTLLNMRDERHNIN